MNQNVFESIFGYENIKAELLRVLDQLSDPCKYADLGVSPPHGLLLYGKPGVGKSTFARSFITAADRKTFTCCKDKPSVDFVKEIVRIFDEAAKSEPSIVFLDDLDKFSNEDERHRDAEEFVAVQACIDKVRDKQVFVVATVNSISKLPDSLVRTGRFDHVLELKIPSGKDAEKIVAHYISQKSFVADVDVKRISRLMKGRSCAELETVINQAGAYAGFAGRKQIEMQDMIKAILRIIFKAPEIDTRDTYSTKMIACHEAGHALVAELLEPDSVDLVTVSAYDSLITGVTSVYQDESFFLSKKQMENRVMCLLAGKAATEICFGTVDTEANSDLCEAFDIVHSFVDHFCSYGFNQFTFGKEQSDGVLDRRDSRVAAEIEHYYALTKQLLTENKDKLNVLFNRLLEEKTLLGDQIQQILRCD